MFYFIFLIYVFSSIVKVDKHMTKIKIYVDNSTKMIIEEIMSSRDQLTSNAQHVWITVCSVYECYWIKVCISFCVICMILCMNFV